LPIKILYIDKQVADYPETAVFTSRFDGTIDIVDDASSVYEVVNAAEDPIQKGKEVLFLTRNKGAFLKSCPGTSHYTCCDYKILHIGTFCNLDCSYCILQAYFHPPMQKYTSTSGAMAFIEETMD